MTAGSGILHPNTIAEGNLVQRTDTLGADAPTFSGTVKFSGGPEAATMQFNLVCTNIPAGSQVAFNAAVPPGVEPIALPWTTVPLPVGGNPGVPVPNFTAGVTTQVNANFQTEFSYEYRSNGYPTPPGFKLTMQALILESDQD